MKPFHPVQSLYAKTKILSSVLKACTYPHQVKQAHALAITDGLQRLSSLRTSTALSYISLGILDSAHLVFLSIPAPCSFLWNVLIRAYATHGQFDHSLSLYSNLLSSGLRPDKYALPFALKSSAALSDIQTGRLLHQQSISLGCSNDLFVDAALVDMYSKCGDVSTARTVFDRMSDRDLVSWNSMISGYANNGYGMETLEFFNLMQHSDVRPNRVSLLGVLLSCSRLGVLRKGECLHKYALQTGFELDILVATAIIDMYAKCGRLDWARAMFDYAEGKDVVCWSAMIANYGYHGLGRDASHMFHRMKEAGVRPNHATFTSLLSACSHSGLLEEGKRYFHCMSSTYGIQPRLNHYACMVDILGRAGKLHEAQELIERMPMQADSSLWGSLLGACRIHGDMDLGERIADKIFELDPGHSGYYVLLSNIYAAKSRWGDVERVRKLMAGRRVSKVQGFSLVELKNHVYKFGVGDKSHPGSKEIYSYLEELTSRMKLMGYVPLLDFSLHDVEDEMKEAALFCHSERLAIVFALINMVPGSPICVTKNIRVCLDCHNAIKFITRIEKRAITVRDMNRFHHFDNGSCSCGDFW